ncbi:hypothetical protein [Thiorhodovibrio winogradskyi]|uniref:hypothetical protein n=1 Tax=Thiorhodovibrio winogradskyi TaxID=77007 RepID=UPI002E29F080|nr:hypothetical protein [Thiorhodovibrio winogradskyi]
MPAPDDPSAQRQALLQTQAQPPTALAQGNHTLHDGDPAQAIRHDDLGLVDKPRHRNGPIAAQLAANLVRAHRRYRQARRHASAQEYSILTVRSNNSKSSQP